MIKLTLVVTTIIAFTAGVSLAPATASDQRPCVSQHEFRDVRGTGNEGNVRGWRQARVANHFDIPGTRIRYYTDGDGVDAVWKYRKCSTWGPGGWYVGIWYDNYSWNRDNYMRVYQKAPNRPYDLGWDFFDAVGAL